MMQHVVTKSGRLQSIIIKVLAVICFISVGAACVMGFAFAANRRMSAAPPEPTITVFAISSQLTNASELTTARYNCRSISRFESGEIPIINKKSFNVIYDAVVKAGVDLSQAVIDISDDTVRVRLPAATVHSVEIDSNSFEFYDEKLALFNWEQKNDMVEILKTAEKDVLDIATEGGILTEAETHARTVVTTLITPLIEQQSSPMSIQFT